MLFLSQNAESHFLKVIEINIKLFARNTNLSSVIVVLQSIDFSILCLKF